MNRVVSGFIEVFVRVSAPFQRCEEASSLKPIDECFLNEFNPHLTQLIKYLNHVIYQKINEWTTKNAQPTRKEFCRRWSLTKKKKRASIFPVTNSLLCFAYLRAYLKYQKQSMSRLEMSPNVNSDQRTKEKNVSFSAQIFKIRDVCSASVEIEWFEFYVFFRCEWNEKRQYKKW